MRRWLCLALALWLPLSQAEAQACFERLRPEVVQWTNAVNAGQAVMPSPHLVYKIREARTDSYAADMLVADLVLKVADEVQAQAVRALTEFLYVVRDETALADSSANAPEDRIPGLVIAGVCPQGCSQEERVSIRQLARQTLGRLKADGVRRLTLRQIAEDVRTHAAGLNSVLSAAAEKRASYIDFRLLYSEITATATGRLLLVSPLKERLQFPTYEEMADPSVIQRAQISLTAIGEHSVRSAVRRFYQEYQASWLISRRLWIPAREILSTSRFLLGDKNPNNPYLWLSRYLEAAPLAVAEVLRRDGRLQRYACDILAELDRYLFSSKWTNAFESLWDGIKLPLWVVGIAVIPTLMSGAPLIIMWAGVTVLKAASVYGMYQSVSRREDLRRWKRFHEANAWSGAGGAEAVETFRKYDAEIHQAEVELGLSLALELGSIGVAHAAAARTLARFRKMSDDELAGVLSAQVASGRRSSSSRAVRQLIESKFKPSLKTEETAVFHFVRSTPRAQMEEIFFESLDLGFGRTLFLTSAGVDLSTTVYQAATADYFSEINPYKQFMGALTER